MPVALVAPERHLTVAAGLRRAHARRGPPAAGHRLRAAGRRARLPAARRPRALPRGLRGARRRPRAPHGRALSTAGGVRPALPGAQRRGHGRGRLDGHARPRRRRHRRWRGRRRRSSCCFLAHLGVPVALAGHGERASATRVLDAAAGPGARRRAPRCSREHRGCAATTRCAAHVARERRAAARARATSRSSAYDSATAYALARRDGPDARRLDVTTGPAADRAVRRTCERERQRCWPGDRYACCASARRSAGEAACELRSVAQLARRPAVLQRPAPMSRSASPCPLALVVASARRSLPSPSAPPAAHAADGLDAAAPLYKTGPSAAT